MRNGWPPNVINHPVLTLVNTLLLESQMGDWSAEPWGCDEAADWFHCFWKGCDFTMLIEEIRNFDPREERYDSVRAASYLLQTLGIVYVWPAKYGSELRPLLEEAITILNNLIAPPNEDWGYLEMCGDEEKVISSVREQISELTMRLRALTR